MAAYRHQYLLPHDALAAKGIFTWLVCFGQKLCFLHPIEASRLFGFGLAFLLAMTWTMIPRPSATRSPLFGLVRVLVDMPLREVVALMVCGWKFLRELALRRYGRSVRLVQKVFGVGDQTGPILVRHPGSVRWIWPWTV